MIPQKPLAKKIFFITWHGVQCVPKKSEETDKWRTKEESLKHMTADEVSESHVLNYK